MDDKTITIRNAPGKWSVRAGGAVLVESGQALELIESGHPPVIYFPREDIAMAFLDRTDHRTHCPWKGDATHFSIMTKSRTLENAAWSYESPTEEMARIAGYVAFYPGDAVTVEQL